ncbi:MAG TPA: hypothetical protein VHB54_21240 [Mucilaginibacter sp.]|nr:hypothetical protein [Mucilaginibacter sp.]
MINLLLKPHDQVGRFVFGFWKYTRYWFRPGFSTEVFRRLSCKQMGIHLGENA